MRILRPLRLISLLGVVTSVLFADRASVAQTGVDGMWTVLAITEAGNCAKAYRYPVQVDKNIIRNAPGISRTTFNVLGQVDSGGMVKASIQRGDFRADAVGRLSRAGSSSGTWTGTGAGLPCSGKWTADQR